MEIISNHRCIIGEGRIWNEFQNKLYQVNGYGPNEILIIDVYSGEKAIRKLPFGVAAIAFSKSGKVLISCVNGAFYLNDDGTREPLYDTEKYEIKFCNDAKVGPDGRLYIGTQSSKRKGVSDDIDGKLYCIDKNGEVKLLLDNLLLDKQEGSIEFSGRQVLVPGVDGFTIDKNGFLYVACWGRGQIAVVDTADMQVKNYITVPAQIPASCAFAGKNMEKLIVVTAALNVDINTDAGAGYI